MASRRNRKRRSSRSYLGLWWDAVQEWNADHAATHAAAIAFYTVFSLAPMAIVAMTLAGFVFDPQSVRKAMLVEVDRATGPEGREAIERILGNASAQGFHYGASWGLWINVGVMVFGATAAFVQLKESINAIWHCPPPKLAGWLDWLRVRLVSFVMVAGIGALLVIAVGISEGIALVSQFLRSFSLPGGWLAWKVLDTAIFFFLVTLLFAMLFKLLPDRSLAWQDVAIGAAVSSVLFAIGKFLIGLYLTYSSLSTLFGAAGSLAVLFMWVYYSAMIFLLGCEFTKVYARDRGRLPENGRAGISANRSR
jgi:membrane protein